MAAGDLELLSGLKQSDRSAYEVLFRRYYPSLVHQIWYRTHDRDLSEEIAQESFVRLWVRRGEVKPHLPLLPYLIVIGVNQLRDNQKHAGVAFRHEESVRVSGKNAGANPAGENPEERVSLHLLEERISVVINRDLSEICRSIFILSRIEGKSNTEIADLIGISTKKVENQLYHALTVLRKNLSAYK